MLVWSQIATLLEITWRGSNVINPDGGNIEQTFAT